MAPQAPACLSYAKAMGSFIHLLNVHKEWFFMKGFCLEFCDFTPSHITAHIKKIVRVSVTIENGIG